MKIALLLAVSTVAIAVEVHPEPGMHLDPASFTDLRLMVGVPARVAKATAAGVEYEMDSRWAPRFGLQWVHGTAGNTWGAALAVELAYDQHRGEVSKATGVQTVYGTGETHLSTVTLGVMPKLVLRPDYDDPFDWGPGSVQIELGPVFSYGYGKAQIGGSEASDRTEVFSWGGRMDIVWTTDHRWQVGLSLGWETFEASPYLSGNASISGSGVMGGLLLGRRL